jgi:hypothetical protein
MRVLSFSVPLQIYSAMAFRLIGLLRGVGVPAFS